MSKKSIHTLSQLQNEKLIEAITPELQVVASRYAVAISPAMLELARLDKQGPISKQFIPTEAELATREEELADPISDEKFSPVTGIVHRYPDRLLLKLLGVCPVYCRFCFRREQVGPHGKNLTSRELSAALDYIRGHEEIWEVILTGGDPLLLSDHRLAEVLDALRAIPHVKVLRLHTRIPVVMPERITPPLLKILKGSKPVYILLHCNHVAELTENARKACAQLVDAGVSLLSQSVLLRGVNDTAEALEQLMRAFVENRIKPHYLHHGDLARGTSHFRVPLEKAQALLRAMRGRVSGLCQPNYMLDIPGGFGKVPVGPQFMVQENECWQVEDVHGQRHEYKESVDKG